MSARTRIARHDAYPVAVPPLAATEGGWVIGLRPTPPQHRRSRPRTH